MVGTLQIITNTIADCSIFGDHTRTISAKENLRFCIEGKEHYIKDLDGCVVVVPKNIDRSLLNDKNTYILSNNPKLTFVRIVNLLEPSYTKNPTHELGYERRRFGTAVVYDHCVLGKEVQIGANSVIGGIGFGTVRDEDKILRFPHFGKVIIGDYVEIGDNCCIDRGSLGDTIIGDYTMFDNLCHVAHNTEIGKRCEMAVGTLIAGSCVIGNDCRFGVGTLVREGISITDKTFLGIGTVVIKDITEPGIYVGNPARFLREWDGKSWN